MASWEEFAKIASLPGSVLGLVTTVGVLRNRWKQWTNPASAKRGDPDLLARHLELYEKIPRYVPAKAEVLATIQELTLEIAAEPARLREKVRSRDQLQMMISCYFVVVLGYTVIGFGLKLHEGGAAFTGLVLLVSGLAILPITMFRFDLPAKREARQIEAKRAEFIKTGIWPDEVELKAKPSLGSRIVKRFMREAGSAAPNSPGPLGDVPAP